MQNWQVFIPISLLINLIVALISSKWGYFWGYQKGESNTKNEFIKAVFQYRRNV